MQQLDIKPMSVNVAWKGRRFKSDDYKSYERSCLFLLKKMEIPKGKLLINLEFGLSNTLCDFDNPVKPIVDILQKKFGFNDKMIYKAIIEKFDVPKGKEFVRFSLESYG